jgi:HK97 family phage major capsid protein
MFEDALRREIAELEEKRTAALSRLDEIATVTRSADADTDTVALDAEVEALASGLDQIAAEIDARAARLQTISNVAEQRARLAAQVPAAPAFVGRAGGGDRPWDVDLRSVPRNRDGRRELADRALRAIEVDDFLDTRNRERVESMLRDRKVNVGGALSRHVLATGSPEYRDAFVQLVTQSTPMLSADEVDALRRTEEFRATIVAGTDANGGYLMPYTLDPTVILTSSGVVNPIRALANVQTTATDNWNGVTSAGITASYDAEGAEVSDDSPTFGAAPVEIHQAQAFAEYSVVAGDDLDSLAEELTRMFVDAKDALELGVFTTGTGSDQPFGFVTGATKVASATTDTYAIGDVYALQNSVAPRWQQGASWMASLAVINLTRQFGTANNHAFLTDLGGGQPSQILGQSLYQNSGMDGTINASADNFILAYGDFSQYRIRDRIGMTVEFVPTIFGANRRPTGKRGWYVRWRNGARLSVADAVKVLNVT